MKKFIEEKFTMIVLVISLLGFLKSCGDTREITKVRKEMSDLEGRLNKQMQIEGVKSEKRSIQASDRKILDVQRQNRMFIELNSSIITAMQENGDLIRVHLQVSNLEWIKLTVLSNAPGITVVSPESLADAVEQSARDLLALY